MDDIESAIQYAKKYLEDLLSFFGLNIDVYATHSDDVIELSVPSTHLNGFLIGQRGDTMRSLQYMVSGALKNAGFNTNRVNVDIADYKKQRADRLLDQAEEWVASVKASGKAMDLKPMGASDRRLIHKLAAEMGLSTESVGEGRNRHIVLKPSGEGAAPERHTDSDADVEENPAADDDNSAEEAGVPDEPVKRDVLDESASA